MYNPVSTYRIQFHKGFTFKQFQAVIPYLSKLGVKTIYASPIFKAVPGSMHGYDVTDPLAINPEIGTLEELKAISKQLKKSGIGWLQDVVPNHMAFHPDNTWLMDVLKNGKKSAYAAYFDILWDIPGFNGQLMVPFLGKPFDEALNDGEISIIDNDGLYFDYMGQHYPLSAVSNDLINLSDNKNNLKKTNADKALIKAIAAKQHYRLCSWQETNQHINYRRFFTVNGLICLNIQDKKAFDGYHKLIGKLVKEGVFQGLRVDHIDGLYNPENYLKQLRALAGNEAYIITEKILETGEHFPKSWPVQGNTGYDMLSTLNNLFTNSENKKALSDFYTSLHTGKASIEKQTHQKKRLILMDYMPGELDNLYHLFVDTCLTNKQQDSIALKEAIAELMILFPVYRLYGNSLPLPDDELEIISNILSEIAHSKPALKQATEIIEDVLLKRPRHATEKQNEFILKFYQRLMQFTGPLMAKGVEDTLMYTYNRFIDHNEVGDSPSSFGIKPKDFHKEMVKRNEQWPLSMTATATHDTKRGEDVRARLNVLSDIAGEWLKEVQHWQQVNDIFKSNNYPDANDEYFIYQTIAGALPMPGQGEDDFANRLDEYLVKAFREGKVNSDWAQPNEEYEKAAKAFAKIVTHEIQSSNIINKLCDFGIINSLAQVLVKYTAPGIPDLYQGCEFWDLSLVDPDNRRPVDYKKHAQLFDKVNADKINWQQLWDERYDGKIKQQLTHLLLKQRNINTGLFTNDSYIPLKIKGKYKGNILAYARQAGGEWLITIIPLHFAAICNNINEIADFDWQDTHVELPGNAPRSWQNLITNSKIYSNGSIPVKAVFTELPFALLTSAADINQRAAGILLHITSLPSAFGIGDIGPEAYQFVDILFKSAQKYWQLLPVNPVDQLSDFSPYSSTSAMAGNILLISPELLIKDGWLTDDDIQKYYLSSDKAELEKASHNKNILYDIAYHNFLGADDAAVDNQFSSFKNNEAYWLDEYAVYETLKEKYKGQPWYQWPKPYKLRDKQAITILTKENQKTIDKIKWLQFVFARQWQLLKQYADDKNVTLLGDMPFYMSYDSADVWANPELFKLNKNGEMDGIAGVPPDYFSAEGQLWGMPVYRWDKHQQQNYNWWINRVKKNLEYFDLIRLDHFRAFAAYWEVAAGNDTAINGLWQQGPGKAFFEEVNKAIGNLPFVAEDLGNIDEAVYSLRDEFNLPGMRVIQFAFDEAMPVSPHIPHNYTTNSFAYTGTHDNNTAAGWFKNDADKQTRKRLIAYAGNKVNKNNVNKTLIKRCYASVAKVVIVPMQDILGLGEDSKMNTPSSKENNWRWKLDVKLSDLKIEKYLQQLVAKYNR